MMNIRNLGSKERLGVKFKDRDMRRIVFKTGIFVILLRQDGFETDCPETKFQRITS